MRLSKILKSKCNAGFSIIELIIAIAVLAFGVVLVYSSFFNIYNATYNLFPRFTAIYLNQEGQDTIRNLRDNNYMNGRAFTAGLVGSPCDTGCMVDYKTVSNAQILPYNDTLFLGLNGDNFYSYETGTASTIFKRKVTITQVVLPPGFIVLKVDVLVKWNYNGQPFSFSTTQYLYNLN